MEVLEKIFYTAGILCLLYYVIIVFYAGITADFAWIWPGAAVFLAGAGGVLHIRNRLPGAVVSFLLIIMAVLLLSFGAVLFQIGKEMVRKPPADLDWVIVLGAQVKGRTPSRALKKRLDAAAKYAAENPGTRLILSGGQGSGEEITEAQAMYEYLQKNGIAPERMLKEERSTTTKENLEYSRSFVEPGAKVGILSNNFHIYRALALAKRCGYEAVYGIPAPSDPLMQPHYLVREVFALGKEKLVKNI